MLTRMNVISSAIMKENMPIRLACVASERAVSLAFSGDGLGQQQNKLAYPFAFVNQHQVLALLRRRPASCITSCARRSNCALTSASYRHRGRPKKMIASLSRSWPPVVNNVLRAESKLEASVKMADNKSQIIAAPLSLSCLRE